MDGAAFPILRTGAGAWDPLIWLCSFAVISVIVIVIRSRGRTGFRHTPQKGMPFYSGNVTAPGRISPANLFWGFLKTLARYYRRMGVMHNGLINDYVFWLVFLVIVIGALLLAGGIVMR